MSVLRCSTLFKQLNRSQNIQYAFGCCSTFCYSTNGRQNRTFSLYRISPQPCVPQTWNFSRVPTQKTIGEWSFTRALSFTPTIYTNKNKNNDIETAKQKNRELPAPIQKPGESDGRFKIRRMKFLLQTFALGFKDLWTDVKLMFRIRSKWRKHGGDIGVLTRDEVLHMHNTWRDLVHTLPVLVVFWLPGAGYFVPVVAFMFPKQLLCQHFWTAEQKAKFRGEADTVRRENYAKLLDHVESYDSLHGLVAHVRGEAHPVNAQLLQFQDVFNEALSLSTLPKEHVVALCKCWSIGTPAFFPRWWLLNNLEAQVKRVQEDDSLIVKEGGALNLSDAAVVEACYERGLGGSSVDSLRPWLLEWIELSTRTSRVDNKLSFIAHSAVLKSLNGPR